MHWLFSFNYEYEGEYYCSKHGVYIDIEEKCPLCEYEVEEYMEGLE